MSELVERLRAARVVLPPVPPVPDGLRTRLAAIVAEGATVPARGRPRRARRAVLLLVCAGGIAAGGVAAAGVNPFDVPPAAKKLVRIHDGVVVGTAFGGTQQVVLARARGDRQGLVCLTLANAQEAGDVSPVVCRERSAIDTPGFDYFERPPGTPAVGLHVRVPDASSLGSAIVTEYRIPARGGVVTFESGGRLVRRSFPDTTRLDARADADMRAFLHGLVVRVRRELSDPGTRARLASLPDVERQALELRVLEGLSYEEIAERTGVGVPQARARVSGALAALGIDLHRMLP